MLQITNLYATVGDKAVLMSLIIAAILTVISPVSAQTSDELTADQKGYIAYDQCLMHAAIEASRTDAGDDSIYTMAKGACAATRAAVIVGLEQNKEYLAALDALDADKATNFPSWIKGVRERRAAREAQFAKPQNAPNQ